jgi:hypothetical protein
VLFCAVSKALETSVESIHLYASGQGCRRCRRNKHALEELLAYGAKLPVKGREMVRVFHHLKPSRCVSGFGKGLGQGDVRQLMRGSGTQESNTDVQRCP